MTPKQRLRYFAPEDSYKEMLRSSQAFENEKQPFKKGDFVYRDYLPKGAFAKGTDEKRGQIFIIDEVLKDRKVKRYKLLNLDFKPVLGSCYKENLRKVPVAARPTSTDFFK